LSYKILAPLFTFFIYIIGAFSSSGASDPWYVNLSKSSLNPPGYVFGIVWGVLYILMAISAYRVFDKVYKLFFLQLFFNGIWSWLFFFFHLPIIALIDIWILIFLNILIFKRLYKAEKFSAYIYLPYIFWLLFASYLNLYIILNN
tara:strand:- start:461 stop:895 length:435 start_codon:yes stop_codon:yes gene_type:complete